MDNFKIIYKILKILEKSMDLEEFDKAEISSKRFGITQARWCRIMAMLAVGGYVSGIEVWNTLDLCVTRPEITLKGLEYLEENTIMKKAADLAKGIKEILPGM